MKGFLERVESAQTEEFELERAASCWRRVELGLVAEGFLRWFGSVLRWPKSRLHWSPVLRACDYMRTL